MKNTIAQLIETHKETPYRFSKKTGICENTAYRLVNDPAKIPNAETMTRICKAYQVQPGDFLVYVPDA